MTSGKEFGGRNKTFRTLSAVDGTGILLSAEPNATWKTLRKISHKYLKQFGDGMSRLESIICLVAEDMFSEMAENAGSPFDPHHVVFDAALNNMAFLITGERTRSGESVVEDMKTYEILFLKWLSETNISLGIRILDAFPWLRFFGWPSWNILKQLRATENAVWCDVKSRQERNPDLVSICKVLDAHMNNTDEGGISDNDIRKTAMSLLLAGVTTTSSTFYAGINILAHNPDIQAKLWDETERIVGSGRSVAVTDKKDMPYTRAVLLELLRYTTVVNNGVLHRTLQTTKLQGYTIPANVKVVTSLYNLHHDSEFWGDPEVFRPGRFLDEAGEVVLADHPNRKHLLPFGAGMRVCLGESMARARLFLWLTSLIQKFEIRPAKGNEKWMSEPTAYVTVGVLKHMRYQVVFKQR